MPLSVEIPHLSLQEYVNAYVVYDQPEPSSSQDIVPIGSQFLWFFLKGDATIKKDAQTQFKLPPVVMQGFWTRAFRATQTFPIKVIAVNFRPYSAHALFGLNMIQYQNDLFDLSTGKYGINDLVCALQQTTDVREVKQALDEWFLLLSHKFSNDISAIKSVTEKIQEKHGNITVDEILHTFFITERTLERLFDKCIGVNPKLYIRLQRFDHVLSQLKNDEMSLQDVIIESGYFDQSHFIKDFIQFTNCSPSVFKKADYKNFLNQTLTGIFKTTL